MATVIYEGPDGTVSADVAEEDLDYHEDYWLIHREGDEYTYLPRERVFSVELSDTQPLPE